MVCIYIIWKHKDPTKHGFRNPKVFGLTSRALDPYVCAVFGIPVVAACIKRAPQFDHGFPKYLPPYYDLKGRSTQGGG